MRPRGGSEAQGSLLSDEELQMLQAQVSELDQSVHAPNGADEPRNTKNPLPKRGAIERMAWEIAGRALEAQLRQQGVQLHKADFDRTALGARLDPRVPRTGPARDAGTGHSHTMEQE
jgi:hypothetical protein